MVEKTNFILLKLQNKSLTKKLVAWLAKKKIYIRANFPHPLENYVRISLGSEKLSTFYNAYINGKK